MEKDNTQKDLFTPKNGLEVLPKKSVAEPFTPADWTSRPVSQNTEKSSLLASSIPPGKRTPVNNSSVSWLIKRKTAEQHKKDRVGKYAQYFKDNTILPIPGLVETVETKTLSFIVSDFKTRKLAGVRKKKKNLKSSSRQQESHADHTGIIAGEALPPWMSCYRLRNSQWNCPEATSPQNIQDQGDCVQRPCVAKWRRTHCISQRIRRCGGSDASKIGRWDGTRWLRPEHLLKLEGFSGHSPYNYIQGLTHDGSRWG